MMEKLRLNTAELCAGDIVIEWGMRVRLPAEGRVYDGQGFPGYPVYRWDGQVENLDEVLAEGLVPHSFLCESRWVVGQGWVQELTGRWVIQGNNHAMWSVERGTE